MDPLPSAQSSLPQVGPSKARTNITAAINSRDAIINFLFEQARNIAEQHGLGLDLNGDQLRFYQQNFFGKVYSSEKITQADKDFREVQARILTEHAAALQDGDMRYSAIFTQQKRFPIATAAACGLAGIAAGFSLSEYQQPPKTQPVQLQAIHAPVVESAQDKASQGLRISEGEDIFQPLPAPKLKQIVLHPFLKDIVLSPTYRSNPVYHYPSSYKIEAYSTGDLKDFPDFMVTKFIIPNTRTNQPRLSEDFQEICPYPPYDSNSVPIPQFKITIPGDKESYYRKEHLDQSLSGIRKGASVDFPEPFGYRIVGAEGFSRVKGNRYLAQRDFMPWENIVLHAAKVKLNIPNDLNDNRTAELSPEEKRLREMVRANRSDPNRITMAIKDYIAGTLINENGWKPVDNSNAFIYVQAPNQESQISKLFQQLSPKELRELKICQCELGSSGLYDLLHDILPCAVAVGEVHIGKHDQYPDQYFLSGSHARFVFEDANGEVHMLETVGDEIKSAHTDEDISPEHAQTIFSAIEAWRLETDPTKKERMRMQIRNAISSALQINTLENPYRPMTPR